MTERKRITNEEEIGLLYLAAIAKQSAQKLMPEKRLPFGEQERTAVEVSILQATKDAMEAKRKGDEKE